MHLDASFIIADPRRESKTYRKNPAEKLKCIVEVADAVILAVHGQNNLNHRRGSAGAFFGEKMVYGLVN